jgi:excisionase family DNA binding protein
MYTVKEVSEKFNINYRTLVREVHRGKLHATRKGGIYIISDEDLLNYQSDCEVVATLNVIIVLVVKDDEMLIVKRKHPEKLLIWQNPSGLLRKYRSVEEQVVEVCKSEADINVKFVKKIGTRISPDTKANLSYFLCNYIDGEIKNLDIFKNSEVKWIKRTDALKYFTSDVYERLLEYFVDSVD